jgi:hypothetical protein
MADEIIKELWEIKDGIAREHGYDMDALIAHLQTRRGAKDQQVVDLSALKRAAEQGASPDADKPRP